MAPPAEELLPCLKERSSITVPRTSTPLSIGPTVPPPLKPAPVAPWRVIVLFGRVYACVHTPCRVMTSPVLAAFSFDCRFPQVALIAAPLLGGAAKTPRANIATSAVVMRRPREPPVIQFLLTSANRR